MAFEFKKGKWYLAFARKSFAGISKGQRLYFIPYKWMDHYWVVFDGVKMVRAVSIEDMKIHIESDKDSQGCPIVVDEKTNETLWKTIKNMGFMTWKI